MRFRERPYRYRHAPTACVKRGFGEKIDSSGRENAGLFWKNVFKKRNNIVFVLEYVDTFEDVVTREKVFSTGPHLSAGRPYRTPFVGFRLNVPARETRVFGKWFFYIFFYFFVDAQTSSMYQSHDHICCVRTHTGCCIICTTVNLREAGMRGGRPAGHSTTTLELQIRTARSEQLYTVMWGKIKDGKSDIRRTSIHG